LRELPPYTRLIAWPYILDGDNQMGFQLVENNQISALRSGPGDQISVQISKAQLDSICSPEGWMAKVARCDAMRGPLSLITVLALWDEAIRQADIYDGNVYLASEDAVDRLLNLTGIQIGSDLALMLDWLSAFELLYRFPVAYKFRPWYGPERQCRLNGWGRYAYRILCSSDAAGLPIEHWRDIYVRHALEFRDCYRAGILSALQARDSGELSVWQAVQALPVPLLI
jgi:hypothetical protein